MKLFVRVKPGKKKESIAHGDSHWLISINAQAVDGKANERLIEFLSEILELPKSRIAIEKGHASPFKVMEISGNEKLILETLNSKAGNKH
jgi:uncharacterized protein (TIGR00251 family)